MGAAGDDLDPTLREIADDFFGSDRDDGSDDVEETPEAAPEDDGEGLGDEEGGEEAPPEPPSTDDDLISFEDGYAITRTNARELAQFQQWLASNPAALERVTKALQEPEEPPAAPALPEIDREMLDADPTLSALYGTLQQQQATISELRKSVEAHDQYVNSTQMSTVDSLVNRATASFQKEHKLSDEEIKLVSETAARLQVLPSLLSPIDPKTGNPRKVDPLAAVEESLEIAMWNIPTFRERELDARAVDQKANDTRKRKLSSLSGGGNATPRTAAEPKNERERRDAMIAEVAGMLRGEGNS